MTPHNLAITKLFAELDVSGFDRSYTEVGKYLSVVNKPFIKDYLDRTHGARQYYKLEIVEVFEITRPQCSENYRSDLTNKRLLLHGTSKDNVYSILRDGFKLTRASSANYSNNSKQTGYIFLSEVALGEMKTYSNSDRDAHKDLDGFNSVFGEGSCEYSEEGRVVAEDVVICPGSIEYLKRKTLQYNEYVVYDTNQIHLKYLVKVRFSPPDISIICFIVGLFVYFLFILLTGLDYHDEIPMSSAEELADLGGLVIVGITAFPSLCVMTYELISKPIKLMGFATYNLLS